MKSLVWLCSTFWLVGFLNEFVPTVLAKNCPSSITCITSDTTKTCKDRGLHYRENILFNGCCPGCVKLAEENEPCINNIDCAPGYKCDTSKNVCIEDQTQLCEVAKKTAQKLGSWEPECLPDGTYAPKQCKGEEGAGRCFCFSPVGNRIFGEEEWVNAANMTCGCSSLMWKTLQVRPDVSLHCTDQGNFEELQCDDGLCWCAHEITGEPFAAIVPETMMKTLLCYDVKKHGDQYLRQCDSQRVSQTKVRQLLAAHGTENIYFPPVSCNYDGSYSRVRILDNSKKCVSKDGIPTPNARISDLSDTTMTCNCEYDSFIADGGFSKACLPNGNYNPIQYDGDKPFCVDSDGYNTPCPQKKKS